MTGLSIPNLEIAYRTLYALSDHLRARRDAWLEAHPRDEVDDAYTYGINVPAGRNAPQDRDIAAVEAALLVAGKEITYQRAEARGRVERGEVCSICEQPPLGDHQLDGYDMTGGSKRRFNALCRLAALNADGTPR